MALLERQAEAERLAALIDDARAGRGGVLAIDGPAGIGKTRLLEEAARLGAAAGVTVLSARGGELEREFAFGIVRDLFEAGVARDPALLEGAGRRLEPAPLSEAAIATLAAQRLGAEPDAAFARACHRVTGGNALLVEELLAEVKETGLAPDERVGAERIGRRVARRIAALGGAAAPLAEAVAVLGDDCALDTAAALAGVAAEDARAAAAALASADILADAPGLRFRHPMVRAAVIERIPAVELARAHARAARTLAERGAPPSALVKHLLPAPPAGDPWVVETLRHAARDSRAQGAPEAAVHYLRRALEEPPPAGQRADVLHELGTTEHVAGLPTAAARLDEARAALGDPVARSRIAFELVATLSEQGSWRAAAATGRDALADLGGADRELDLLLQALVADAVRMDPGVGGDEPLRLRALVATLAGETAAERAVIAAAAAMTPAESAAEHARAAELMRRGGLLVHGYPATGVVSNLIRAGRLDDAARVIEEELDDARAHGFVRRYATMLSLRGWAALERGELATARDDLEATLALVADHPAPTAEVAAGLLAAVCAEEGAVDEAGALLDAHGLAGELPSTR